MATAGEQNRFQLGLFAHNAWGGLTKTLAPTRWSADWDNNVRVAQLAEEAGFDFLLPFAVWLDLEGDASTDGWSLETLTWAAATLATTERITVFATVHTPFIHPVFAAKQAATCNRIGNGRFGLNIVSGWGKPDFDHFGIEMLDHDERYDYTEEWLEIVKELWTNAAPFDHEGRYFQLKGAKTLPRPVEPLPRIVSAGSSPVGRAFAARHADFLFMIIVDSEGEGLEQEIEGFRALAGDRKVGAYASGHVICRETSKEADEYYDHIVHEHGDWAGAEYWKEVVLGSQSIPPEALNSLLERYVSGQSTFLVKGDPDEVAHTFKRLSDAGLDGMAFGLVNYLDDLPIIRDEVIPRMKDLGLRESGADVGLVPSAG